MKKKLKLRIIKLTRCHIIELLQKRGNFPNTVHVRFSPNDIKGDGQHVDFYDEIQKRAKVWGNGYISNKKRDDTVKMIIEWITNEQFNGKAPKIDGEIYTWEGE